MKKIVFVISAFVAILISIPIINGSNRIMNAATSYTTGNQVYVGNESFTVIDPNTMTLLADQSTADGEMTWDNAVSSLNGLASEYGELGSKAVTGNFTLPKTSDLSSLMNGDQTALTTISPIDSDWWLGDESVDNRSKFVGANTNSLVTDVTILKNVLDKNTHVCNMDQSIVEKGIKPTIAQKDIDIEDTYESSKKFELYDSSFAYNVYAYEGENCTGNSLSGNSYDIHVDVDYDTLDVNQAIISKYGENSYLALGLYLAFTEYGLKEYVNDYKQNPSDSFYQAANIYMDSTCKNLQTPMSYNYYGIKSFRSYSFTPGPTSYLIRALVRNIKEGGMETIICPGHEQTAGESSVRPLLTIDPSKIAYSSSSKPSFSVSSTLNQPVPIVNGNASYLTLTDSDLGIALDDSDPNVNEDEFKVDRTKISSTVSIPITLSGNVTSGDRYVSAVANTNDGDAYTVLDIINGSTGNVQLDISNIPDWETVSSIPVILYQEVDEGTNTTYRSVGKKITIKLSSPITEIKFQPNYDDGKVSWNRGDKGISGSGAKTGTFSFTGGTSGDKDPNTNKDYKTWEIVDETGNPITDTNFRITNNELIAKKRIEVGTYILNIKVTDNNDETYIDSITIVVDKEKNPFDWNTSVKNKTTMYYGDILTLGVIGVRENATVTYGPSTHVDGTTFTAQKPETEFEITASTPATTSYGATTIKHKIDIEKRPITVQVQLEDGSGNWSDSLTIKEGEELPNHQVVLDTDDTSSKGLVEGDELTDSKVGTVEYEYRKGTTVVSEPNKTAGTYELYAIYTDSDYYKVTVKAATLTVKKKGKAITLEVEGYLNNMKTKPYDETKWTNQSITLKLKASDGSKLTNQQYSTDEKDYMEMNNGVYTIPNTETIDDQTYYFKATSVDGDEITTSIQIKMDVDAPEDPTVTYEEESDGMMRSLFRSITFNQMFKETHRANFTSDDELSGLDYFAYAITEKDNEGNTIGVMLE